MQDGTGRDRDEAAGRDCSGRGLVATGPEPVRSRAGRPAAPFLTQLLVAETDAGRVPRAQRAERASHLYRRAEAMPPRRVVRAIA